MVAHGYFAHDSRSGARFSARIARVGWMRSRTRWRVGENLAWGTGRAASPRAVLAAWLRSPGHRRVLLRRSYRVVGVGVAAGTPSRPVGADLHGRFRLVTHAESIRRSPRRRSLLRRRPRGRSVTLVSIVEGNTP